MTQSVFGNFDRKPLPRHEELLPLEEMVARIEALRLEAADPTCSTCGSTADASVLQPKWCPSCQQWLSRRCFNRHRARPDGLASWCRDCCAARNKRYRTHLARRGPMSGVAA